MIKDNNYQDLAQTLQSNPDIINQPISAYGKTTILMQVAAEGTAAMIRTVIQQNPDLKQADSQGRTALHYACRSGNLQSLRLLLNQEGIDIEAKTNGGVTPLMCGIQSGAMHVVNELLEAGCSPVE